jgi:hypothetical protein
MLMEDCTLDVNASSLITVEEVECDLGNEDLLLGNTVLSPLLGIEGCL